MKKDTYNVVMLISEGCLLSVLLGHPEYILYAIGLFTMGVALVSLINLANGK